MKQSEIEELLPEVFRRTLPRERPVVPGAAAAKDSNPLEGLLEVMEKLQAPSEDVLQRIDTFFDPRRTTDEFVPYLAYWADLTRLFDETLNLKEDQFAFARSSIASGVGRLRELIASAAYLSQWRGTKKGLLAFLQIATGFVDFDIQENVDLNGQPRPFHVSIHAPKESAQYSNLIERIVELEKPAYVTFELSFEPAGGT
jgi:phage tail-like protein